MNVQGKLISFSFILGLVYTFLFFQKELGISHIIFILFLLGSLAYWLHEYNQLEKNGAWIFSIPIVLLSSCFFISTNMVLGYINQILIVLLFVGMCNLLTKQNTFHWGNARFLSSIVATTLLPIQYFFKPYQWLFYKIKARRDTKWFTYVFKVLLGLLISLPLLGIVIILLSSADMVFNNFLVLIPRKLASLFDTSKLGLMISKAFLTTFIATYSFSYLWYLLESRTQVEEQPVVKMERSALQFDPTVLITVLVALNIVYIVFSFIQFSYLFGNNVGSLPGGFTYAQYARRGFFQLLFVTMINFIILLVTLFFMKQQHKKSSVTIKILMYMIGISTYVMIYSSYYRMGLYQQNYGYTYLRMFVYFFLFLETFLLAGTLSYIVRPKFHLGKMYVVTCLAFYIAFNYINIDNFIAKRNIDLYFRTNKIDANYLTTLSYDAVPEVRRLLNAKNPLVRRVVKNRLIDYKRTLNKDSNWQSFNYSAYRAKKLLKSLE